MKLTTTDIFKKIYSKNDCFRELDEKDLEKLHKILITIAKDIISVMEENNMTYHLTGGSALGAIRHNGFIPWDDDMDIDLARKDVDIFLKIFNEKFKEKYWIYSPYNKELCLPFIQIRLKNTTYLGINDFHEYASGVPIDIAIIENTYDNKLRRKIHGSISLFLGLIVSCRKFAKYKNHYLSFTKDLKEERKIFMKKIRIGQLLSFITLEKWIRMYDKWNSKCKDEKTFFVTVPTGRKHFFKELYERDKFYLSTKHNFEGNSWCIPKDYDYYLTKMYGDYMKLPDKKNIEKHAIIKIEI